MSYQDGLAALNLEMPGRVPRTEYSADTHWPLISAVTGIPVDSASSDDKKEKVRQTFAGPDHWNYDLVWSTLIGRNELGRYVSPMGHAVFAAGGTDYNTHVHNAFSSPEEALTFQPVDSLGVPDHAGLAARFEKHYKQNCNRTPDAVNMTGIYITCVSGLIELFGWEMLLTAAGIDLAAFSELTNRYAVWIQHYFNALADTDVPVVMVHDDIVWTSGAFIHPEWYHTFVFPNYRRFFAPLRIDAIAACGVHAFVMEPTTDMNYVAQNFGKTHAFIGNADTRSLLSGDRALIREEVTRCMEIGKEYPGYFMAVGNHIPANTPVDAAIFYNNVYEELSPR